MHHYVHQTGREDAFTFWAGCGAIRRDLFLDLGGFDERYRNPAIEDIELGYRLKSAGSKILLLKSLQVKHMKPWSPPGLVRTDFTRRALPWAELILRQRHFDNDLNIDLSARISVVAAYMLVGALIASFWWLPLLAIASACVFILLLHNLPLYRFFARKRGLLFALQTVPWHWLYFLYSGLAFALALVRHLYRAHVLRRLIGRDVGWEDSEPPQAVRGR
jgi:GT2 family glycosyltransferase